jgi:ferritin-like metal-binding protein YciE
VKADFLEQIHVDKLKDLYDAEKQIIGALPKMANAASLSDLKEALQKHLEQTKGQVMRLDKIFSGNGERDGGKSCAGMQGLLEEGEELLKQQQKGPALDAALIAAAQSVEHYEMAGYGSAQTWARQPGRTQHASLLEETLEKEKDADAELTEIAQTLVNPEASGTAEEEEDNDEEEEEEEDEGEIEEDEFEEEEEEGTVVELGADGQEGDEEEMDTGEKGRSRGSSSSSASERKRSR